MLARQYFWHLMIPVGVTMLALIFEYSGIDLWWDSLFYDAKNHVWPYNSLYLTEEILHIGAKKALLWLAFLNLLLALASNFVAVLKPYRKHLFYILIAALAGPVIVAYLKGHNHICTPWELIVFGGKLPYIRVFDMVPAGTPIGQGFPGGHSSGGFAYMSLYFALLAMRSKYRYYGLLIPLLVGVVLSITQEVRGAHFPSHDMFSFVVCWLSAMLMYLVFYGVRSTEAEVNTTQQVAYAYSTEAENQRD